MTDLKKGVISFNEIEITNKTTKQEILERFSDVISPASGGNIIYLLKLFTFDDSKFLVTFMFNKDGSIFNLQLNPYIQYKSEKYDVIGQQNERRAFCDKWLEKRLGAPHKIISGDIEYSFEKCDIGCFSNYDVRNAGNGGYIVVVYK